MRKIRINAYAKINLTLDVLGTLDNGYHEVAMVMHQVGLWDIVTVQWEETPDSPLSITLTTNKDFLPTDENNLAYKAALLMAEKFGITSGKLGIDIQKEIPVAAGLAGGSSNGAAVIHALNNVWDLNLTLSELCSIGKQLGSDVPFCIMGQSAMNENLKLYFEDDPLCCHCALATGTGTDMTPLPPFKAYIVLSKPSISVSTAEVYKGIDNEVIDKHPDTDAMIAAINEGNHDAVCENLVNVLENYTLKKYPEVADTKERLKQLCPSGNVLMSGSGPTVYGLCKYPHEGVLARISLADINKETYCTHTTF